MDHNKNKKIFAKNIEPEYKRIFAFIYSRLDKNKELAQDITQNTMEIAWLKIDQIKNVDSTRAWLMQIAMNEIRKYFRMQSSKKRSLYQEESYELYSCEISEQPEQLEKNVLDYIIEKEDYKMVMEALDRIPEKYKILIDLRLIQDLKFSQIANIIALDEAITRVYFNRGLKALNKEYEKILREVANEK